MLRSEPAMTEKEHVVTASPNRNDSGELRALFDRINGAWMTGRPEGQLARTAAEHPLSRGVVSLAVVLAGPPFLTSSEHERLPRAP